MYCKGYKTHQSQPIGKKRPTKLVAPNGGVGGMKIKIPVSYSHKGRGRGCSTPVSQSVLAPSRLI